MRTSAGLAPSGSDECNRAAAVRPKDAALLAQAPRVNPDDEIRFGPRGLRDV